MNRKVIDCYRINFSHFMLVVTCLVGFSATAVHAQWAQWAGPNRDFKTVAIQLATDWAEDGPIFHQHSRRL